jgi:hypothetical protein
MPGGIVYLDVDDEITSAAARIRDLPERRVALVLPYGSRVATSRINFRLLSRDALINEKQLAIVAGDSATRALAASAGLPSFASVGEYESAATDRQDDQHGGPPAGGPPAIEEPAPGIKPAAGRQSRRGQAAKAAETSAPKEPETQAPAGSAAVSGAVASAGAGAAQTGVPKTAVPTTAMPTSRPGPLPAASEDTVQVEIPWTPAPPIDRPWRKETGATAGALTDHRARRPGATRASRLPIIIVLAAFALVVLVGGVAAYVVLPTVSIIVTPRPEPLVPLDIVVTVDPSVTEPDAANRVVPAVRVPLEVAVTDSFPATGVRVEEETARGAVRFANLDFLRSNTIPAGSIVSTNAGARFRTDKEVTVPRADLVGLTVFPGRVTVNVTAVERGTAGNVEPNTIVVIPRGKDPEALKVVNPDATTGGTHEEFPQVAEEDVAAALEQLSTALTAAFEARLVDPSIAPAGATVFPETASLGDPTPSAETDTLVGQEVETFELGLTATGSVLTVDPAPVTAIADELLRATVEPGHQLVAGSIRVDVGAPVVSGQSVAFSATATGQQIAVLDAGELKAQVIGKPLDEARSTLEPYGDVELTAWPDWVGSVPTIADRVDLRIGAGVPVEEPAGSEPTS